MYLWSWIFIFVHAQCSSCAEKVKNALKVKNVLNSKKPHFCLYVLHIKNATQLNPIPMKLSDILGLLVQVTHIYWHSQHVADMSLAIPIKWPLKRRSEYFLEMPMKQAISSLLTNVCFILQAKWYHVLDMMLPTINIMVIHFLWCCSWSYLGWKSSISR